MERIAEAIGAAWPGSNALAKFRRRVAFELATTDNGPRGPHTALSAKLSGDLRSQHPTLVAAVSRLASDGKLHLKQLIAPGPSVKVTTESIPDTTGAAFLYWIPWPSDICLILNITALIKWHVTNGNGGAVLANSNSLIGPVTPPERLPNSYRNVNGIHYVAKGANGPSNSLNGKPAATQIAKSSNGDVINGEEGEELPQPHVSEGTNVNADGSATDASGPRGPSLSDLALLAFPGTAAASQLRRALASRLAAVTADVAGGLPAHTIPWKLLIAMVAGSRAATVQPALTTPSFFRTFLHHPASAGVFAAIRVQRTPGDPASAVDCVSLKPNALRRAADVGLDAAITAAWPGREPVHILKRAAAKVLANAWSTAGTFTMNCGPLGLQLKLRQPWAHGLVKPGGVMAALNEARGGSVGSGSSGDVTGGYLLQVREGGKEGFFRLRLARLLRDFPPDGGRHLGLGEVPPPTAGASSVTDNNSHSSTCTNVAISNNGTVSTATSPSRHTNESVNRSYKSADEFHHAEPTEISSNDFIGATGPWVDASAQSFPSYDDGFFSTADATAAEPAVNDEYVDREESFTFPDPNADAGVFAIVGSNAGDVDTFDTVPAAAHAYGYIPQQLLPPTVMWVMSSTEIESMCNHCTAVAHVGLAVHPNGADRGAIAALYAPAASAMIATDSGSEASQAIINWPGTVYLVQLGGTGLSQHDAASVSAGDVRAQATASVRMLLESPEVIKVVHGCEQVACLAPTCGATTLAPLYDTRMLFTAISAMLPAPPVLPPPPYAAVGPLAVMTLTRLGAHVAGLREGLTRTGLWAERPEMLSALFDRHTAALRQELFGFRDWACNPAGHETVLVAAAQHLPELWDALTYEAVPWVAMSMATSTAAAAMERLATAQAARVTAAAAAAPEAAAASGEEVQRVTYAAPGTGTSSNIIVSQMMMGTTRDAAATLPHRQHVVSAPVVAPVMVISGMAANVSLHAV